MAAKTKKHSAQRYRKTKKASTKKGCSKTMSLPELRTGLQYIEAYAGSVLQKTDDMRQAAADFANEWYAVFQKKLSLDAATDYLKHATSYIGAKGNSTKGAKQKGGMAPVDYQLRAGTLAPYGTYLPYVEKGFDVGVPAMSQTELCAAGGSLHGPLLTPFPDTGSNAMKGGSRSLSRSRKRDQRGAGFLDTLKQVWSHPPPSNPTNVTTDAIRAFRGQDLGPGPDSTTRAYGFVSSPQTTDALKTLYSSASVKSL